MFSFSDTELVWCDVSSGDIMGYNITSDTTHTIVNGRGTGSDELCDITVSNSHMYWVDPQTQGISHIMNDDDSQQYVRHHGKMILADSVQFVNKSLSGGTQ